MHIQTQDFRNPIYRGTYDCFKSIIAKDSIKGLYRGLSSPLAGVSFVNAIVFGVYGNVQRLSSNPNSYTTHFVSGAAAGLIQSFICSPMELAKTQIQVQKSFSKNNLKFQGPMQCLSYTYHSSGIRGVYKGLTITALRDIPGFATYFVTYEYLIRSKNDPGVLYVLLAGGLAGIASWTLTIPIDVVKSRIQVDGMLASTPKYNGIIDCVKKSYQEEGMPFLSRGFGSTLLRSFPMNAVCFLVVSTTLKYWNNLKKNKKLVINHEYDLWNRRRRIVQGLLCIGAFNEAICSSEIIELAHELYHVNENAFHPLTDTLQQFNFHSKFDGQLEQRTQNIGFNCK